MSLPSFSIVINTLNRAASLKRTLDSLRWLRYAGHFEVVVVNGPSTDDSQQVIDGFAGRIRGARCEVANLSISRNIGIAMARGDVVAFIDDDAIPEPEWLEQLAAAYDDPAVGAAGGFVFDHTGYTFQARYCVIDRLGMPDFSPIGPSPQLCFPGSFRFPHLLGTNASFRRSALLEIGGFDEEYEYFLDETDVCVRIVDAGWLVAQLPHAYVHHKYAPSHLRGKNREAQFRFPLLKNRLYFILRHAREHLGLEALLEDQRRHVDNHRNAVNWLGQQGELPAEAVARFPGDAERAWETGLRRGLEGPRPGHFLDAAKLARWQGGFLPFETWPASPHGSIVLVSRDYPPGHAGGIATFTGDLARALARQGHTVHLVACCTGIDHVDFEDGVWVHRLVVRDHALPPAASAQQVPQHFWNWSKTAFDEVARIATHRAVHVVEAPIWDCQGIAFLHERRWPLVTSLQTTMHFWLDTHPDRRADAGWMQGLGTPILRTERTVMGGCDAVRAISAAIRTDIEAAYEMRFDAQQVLVEPLGIADLPAVGAAPPAADPAADPHPGPEVLFVGRFELRKGIDTLLAAIPLVLQRVPAARFRLVGDSSLPGPDGRGFQEAFFATPEGAACADRVRIDGLADEATLVAAYAQADVFVAPSRFESFGLVFVEAMRAGKPVVGCAAGGVPEIVAHEANGLLVPPGDATALAGALVRLLESPEERARMGQAGRQMYEARFTAARMAQASLAIYDRARERHGAATPIKQYHA
ncbi:MAG TPA: glycosyltransferase [Ramlibacter sp.]|nr:glycosyltransferase [Ramlibacter sp.]